MITSIDAQLTDTFFAVNFDRQAGSNTPPPWSIGGTGGTILDYNWDTATRLVVTVDLPLAGGETLEVPAGLQPLWARNNGAQVAAGSYPFPI